MELMWEIVLPFIGPKILGGANLLWALVVSRMSLPYWR